MQLMIFATRCLDNFQYLFQMLITVLAAWGVYFSEHSLFLWKAVFLQIVAWKNRFLSCDHTPEWIRDSEFAHRALGYTHCPGRPSPCLFPDFSVCLGHTLIWAPCSLCFDLEIAWPPPVGKCLHEYYSQSKCGFTPAAKACLLWSPYLPLPGSWAPAGLSSALLQWHPARCSHPKV